MSAIIISPRSVGPDSTRSDRTPLWRQWLFPSLFERSWVIIGDSFVHRSGSSKTRSCFSGTEAFSSCLYIEYLGMYTKYLLLHVYRYHTDACLQEVRGVLLSKDVGRDKVRPSRRVFFFFASRDLPNFNSSLLRGWCVPWAR